MADVVGALADPRLGGRRLLGDRRHRRLLPACRRPGRRCTCPAPCGWWPSPSSASSPGPSTCWARSGGWPRPSRSPGPIAHRRPACSPTSRADRAWPSPTRSSWWTTCSAGSAASRRSTSTTSRSSAGVITGAHRPQRRRQDDLLQPAHRLRQARRRAPGRSTAVDMAGLVAHQVARHGMVRTFQLTKALSKMTVLDNMMLGGHRPDGARSSPPPSCRPPGGPRRSELGSGPTSCSTASSMDHMTDEYAGTLSGGQRKLLEMARALMTEPDAGHARRAHGRRQPGPHPVPARPREGPAGRGHDGDVRRARHGRGPRHQRLGGGDGRGRGHRRRHPRRRHAATRR